MNNNVEIGNENILDMLENARKKTVRNFFLMVIVLIFLLFLVASSEVLSGGVVFVFLPGVIIIGIKYAYDSQKFNKIYKDKIVLPCLQSTFTDVEYSSNTGIARSTIAGTGMMYTGDHFSSSDYVKAKYKDINFECSDVHIETVSTDSEGHTTYTTVFKGQWYIFDFNKSFKSDIEVCEKWFGNNRKGSIFDTEKFKKVELEDVEFHKDFKVYARNEIDAFYVLTPQMIQRIKELNNNVGGKFLFCFCDNKLHIGLYNNKDLYEHSIFSKVDLEKAKSKVLGELLVIIKFVDTLKLDDSLFKRDIELEVNEKEKSLNKKSSNKDDKK